MRLAAGLRLDPLGELLHSSRHPRRYKGEGREGSGRKGKERVGNRKGKEGGRKRGWGWKWEGV